MESCTCAFVHFDKRNNASFYWAYHGNTSPFEFRWYAQEQPGNTWFFVYVEILPMILDRSFRGIRPCCIVQRKKAVSVMVLNHRRAFCKWIWWKQECKWYECQLKIHLNRCISDALFFLALMIWRSYNVKQMEFIFLLFQMGGYEELAALAAAVGWDNL